MHHIRRGYIYLMIGYTLATVWKITLGNSAKKTIWENKSPLLYLILTFYDLIEHPFFHGDHHIENIAIILEPFRSGFDPSVPV